MKKVTKKVFMNHLNKNYYKYIKEGEYPLFGWTDKDTKKTMCLFYQDPFYTKGDIYLLNIDSKFQVVWKKIKQFFKGRK